MKVEDFVREELFKDGAPQEMIDEVIKEGRAQFGVIEGDLSESEMAQLRGMVGMLRAITKVQSDPQAFLAKIQKDIEQAMEKNIQTN